MELIMAGTLAFDLLDRLTGGWTVLDTEWGSGLFSVISAYPGVWFFVNMALWAAMGSALYHFT